MAVTDVVQVQTAAGSREEADRIADALLRGRLAACVQVIGPVQSRYWWQGELEAAEEWLCLAKTTKERTEKLMEAVRVAHSYETPEILVTPVVHGSEAYLQWIAAEVHGAEEPNSGSSGP